MTTFHNPVNLSVNPPGVSVVQVSSAGALNNICVAWCASSGNQSRILLRASHNGGAGFDPSLSISDPILFADRPQIAGLGTYVYVLYVEYHTIPVLLLKMSRDSGRNFVGPFYVGNPQQGTGLPFRPNTQMAAVANNVYAVWSGTPLLLETGIFFARSLNHGLNFDPPIELSQQDVIVNPKIAASGENVYVVWARETDIFAAISHDSGKTFTQPVNLSKSCASCSANRPQIAVSGDYVYVTWAYAETTKTSSRQDIFFTVSPDAGKQFEASANLTNNPYADNNFDISDFPRIAAEKEYVYVVWQTGIDMGFGGVIPGDIFFSQNDANGKTASFLPAVNVSARGAQTVKDWLPKVAADGSRVSVAWSQINPKGGQDELYYSSSGDHGAAPFETPIDLGAIMGSSDQAHLLPALLRPYVTWNSNDPNAQSDAIFVSGKF
jgi:hypothetical protein